MQTGGRALLACWILVAALGCGDPEARKVNDRFLTALKDEDYAAAFEQLHSDARESVRSPEALRKRVEASGHLIQEWSVTCSAGSKNRSVIGYSPTYMIKWGGKAPTGLLSKVEHHTVGVEPEGLGKCNGPLLLELRPEDGRWKVRSFRW